MNDNNEFPAVETQTMTKAVELEIQSGVRDPSNQITKSQPTLHSLHERLVKICKGFTKQGMNSDNIDDKFLCEITGTPVQRRQPTLLDMLRSKG